MAAWSEQHEKVACVWRKWQAVCRGQQYLKHADIAVAQQAVA